MKPIFTPIIPIMALAILFASSGLTTDAIPKLEKATALEIRQGLPNFAAKLKEGKEVNIVFLGGSITVGGEQQSNGYVNFIRSWLLKNYPAAKVNIFNAGIPGSGSDYAAKRFDRDVLSRNPDLILIEFSVNDGNLDRTVAMERMVQKAWRKNPATDILIFYTIAQTHLPYYKAGNLPPSASAHERVAVFYEIPSLGTGYRVAASIAQDLLKWEQFSLDSCHPTHVGYNIYNETFAVALPTLLKDTTPVIHRCDHSITPDLEVYPKPRIAQPVDSKQSFTSAKGEKALKVYPLPVPGLNWVGEPSFDDQDGKTIWRLSWVQRDRPGVTPDGNIAIDKTKWENNAMTWFEEDGSFTAGKSTALFRQTWKTALFGVTDKFIGIIRFIAPQTGRYAFVVQSSTWGEASTRPDNSMSMTALKFTWNGNIGQVLAMQREERKSPAGLAMKFETLLTAGEEIVFVPDADTWNGAWRNFNITVGYLGE